MHPQHGAPPAVHRALRAAAAGDAASVERIEGGTAKGVYRVELADGTSLVVYRWHHDEGRSDPVRDDHDQLGSSGPAPFLAAHRLLGALGLRVPELHTDVVEDADGSSVLVLEDLGTTSLERHLQEAQDAEADATMRAFAGVVRHLHDQHRPGHGPLLPEATRTPVPGTFHDAVLRRALRDLEEVAEHERVRPLAGRLQQLLLGGHGRLRPRGPATLLHGELGPDHVLLDRDGTPCLIDIEGLAYGDLEWEHAFLALRLGDRYRWLARDDLDGDRLRFYGLALHLSLVAGPLHLLARGDDPFLRGVVEHNLRRLRELAAG